MYPDNQRYALILAAGKGTRFKSDRPKVLHPVCGKPMILFLLERLPQLGIEKSFVVVGEDEEQVMEALSPYDIDYIKQEVQLGTGHAVMSAITALAGLAGSLLVLYGDTPLIRTEVLRLLVEERDRGDADEAILTVELEDPTGYGRIIRNEEGHIVDIVEEREATAEQKKIREINAGFVCFKISSLLKTLPQLDNKNSAGEYYLTDMAKIMDQNGMRVLPIRVDCSEETIGINNRAELARAEERMRRAINLDWLSRGVTMLDPSSVYIDAGVSLGPDTMIHPGVVVEGASQIGRNCTLYGCSRLTNAILEENVVVDHCCIVRNSRIPKGTRIQPFTHVEANRVIRPQTGGERIAGLEIDEESN